MRHLTLDDPMTKHTTVVRMSAAAWTATVTTQAKTLHFDLRRMTKDERRAFHASFMAAYRAINPYTPRKGSPR